jgi:Skp family chaperone for outer membrane proteins
MIKSPSIRRAIFAAAVGILLPLTPAVQAQPKIATVDLRKIFEGYYKTIQADAQLRERGAEAEKQYKGMLDDYQKANEDYKKLVESANDQAVSSEERDKRKKSAETKILELNDIEKNLTQFQREKRATFDEQKKRMRDQIVREIREIIDKKARSGNYNFVFDSSALSASNFEPLILFSSGQSDLTEEILAQINLAAPPGVLDRNSKSNKADIKLNMPEPEKEKPSKKTK